MFLPDLSFGLPGHGFHQLVAHPVLQRAVGDQHIAGAARIALADTHLLVADADDADRAHLAGDPVLAAAFGPRAIRPGRRLLDSPGRGVEARDGSGITDRLVRPLGVVYVTHSSSACCATGRLVNGRRVSNSMRSVR